MAKQLMIYDNIQPLSTDLHRNYAVKVTDYKFAAELISVPVLANEIPYAATDFPIVFSATANEGEYVPLALMGLKSGENLMLNEEGQFAKFRGAVGIYEESRYKDRGGQARNISIP